MKRSAIERRPYSMRIGPLYSIPLFVMLGLLLMLTGCGGSSSSPVVTPPKGTPFEELGTRERLLQDSDRWTYNLTGTVKGTTGEIPLTGEVQMLLNYTTVQDQDFRALSQIFDLTSAEGHGILSNSRYIYQDPTTRLITTYGVNENGTVRMYTTPLSPLLKNGNIGESATRTFTYSDGSTVEETSTVVGTELITVTAGKFMTYKVTSTQKTPDRTTTSTTWYSRQLGSFVQSDDVTELSTGDRGVRHLELTSTNVVPAD